MPILVWIASTGVRLMRIRTGAVLLAVRVLPLSAPLTGRPEAGWRLPAAAVVLGVGVALFGRWEGAASRWPRL